jgi:hypothetical protein
MVAAGMIAGRLQAQRDLIQQNRAAQRWVGDLLEDWGSQDA